MSKIAVLMLLLAAFASSAAAKVYSCRGAHGHLMFTDDPANFPPGCRPVAHQSAGKGGGGLTIIPSPPVPTEGAERLLKEQAQKTAEKKSRIEQWKTEARRLARDFRKAAAERIPTLPVPQIQKGLEKMNRIERRAEQMRREAAAAGIPDADRAEIESLLAAIPPPP